VKRRSRTPLVLAAIAVALGAYIALVERRHESTDERRAARVELLPGFERRDVKEVEIKSPTRGRQRLAQPAELLDALEIAEIDREATIDARAAGLDPPAARLLIRLAGQGAPHQLTLDLGSVDASGRGVYVRPAGDPRVLVTGKHLRELVDRALASSGAPSSSLSPADGGEG
jgi:hypothetical protein